MLKSKPIGIFDSGVGGLSVAREIRNMLPAEDMLYFADSAYCPYGAKTPAEILKRSESICRFLLQKGAKMLVVACNTASIAGLDQLRQYFKVPIVGMEPAVKPATEATKNGIVGVLATGVTLTGDRFSALLERFGNGAHVITQPCPGLVELVEEGKLEGPKLDRLLDKYLTPLLEEGADTIVLGCTHYPFLRKAVQERTGPGVRVIDTGEAVARQVQRILTSHGLINNTGHQGREYFFTSGNPQTVQEVISRLWSKAGIAVDEIDI